ncbi:MAG TPA: hypothetical protein DDZ76_04175 [Xanthomonadales bacterium]|nr:hypothetical protein [Xanthomonadales bacterium]
MTPSAALFSLLPILIAGYVFGAFNYRLRYFSLRAEGQRLFFMSAGLGLAAVAAYTLFICFIEWLVITLCQANPGLFDHLRISPDHPGRPTAWMALFAFAWLSARLGNLIDRFRYRKSVGNVRVKVFSKLIAENGSSLARLLRRAVDSQKLVLITLKSRKVYCGRIIETPADIDHDSPFVELLPIFSSHRDKDSLELSGQRTPYPIIALWEAQIALKVAEKELEEFDRIIGDLKRPDLMNYPGLEHTRSELQRRKSEATNAIEGFLKINEHISLMDIKLDEWIKVIPIDEIESASFFETSLPEHWFKKDSVNAPEEQVARSAGGVSK